MIGLQLPLSAYSQAQQHRDLCLSRDGPSHAACPPHSLFPKWQKSGSDSQFADASPENYCWFSPSLGRLVTGTTALGICACPETDQLMTLVLHRPSFRNGIRPASSPRRKMQAPTTASGFSFFWPSSHRPNKHWRSLLSKRQRNLRRSFSAEFYSEKGDGRLLLPEGKCQP